MKTAWLIKTAESIQPGMRHPDTKGIEMEAWIPLSVSLSFTDDRLIVVRKYVASDGFMYTIYNTEDGSADDLGVGDEWPVPDPYHSDSEDEIDEIEYIVIDK